MSDWPPDLTANWCPPWKEPAWQAEAVSWIDARLGERDLVRDKEIDQFHIRAWSTVMRIDTNEGTYYFKAGAPSQDMEPALLQILARVRPQDTSAPIAVDVARGWSITADRGPTLRQVIGDTDSKIHFPKLLPQYAEYQIATMPYVEEILTVGCPDRRLGTLSELFELVASDDTLLRIKELAILSEDDHRRLMAMRPEVEELCNQITVAGVPAAIEHGDLHSANIFADGDNYTFFDWADASVSHPFFSLVVMMRTIAGDRNSQDPTLHWARDAYLEPFTKFAPMPELQQVFTATQRLGRFQRSLAWVNVLQSIAPDHLKDALETVPAWLWLFLHFPQEKF